MADELTTPIYGLPITDQGDLGAVATLELQSWMSTVTAAVNNIRPLTGSGSPEGVSVASAGRWYVDIDVNVIYYKKTGDTDIGWVIT